MLLANDGPLRRTIKRIRNRLTQPAFGKKLKLKTAEKKLLVIPPLPDLDAKLTENPRYLELMTKIHELVEKEMNEHPWMTSAQAYRIVREHLKATQV